LVPLDRGIRTLSVGSPIHACGFPVDAYQFMKQSLPRWATNDDATQAAYDAVVARVGECIVLAHSQDANFALRGALAAPNRVRAVVLLAASGAPDRSAADAVLLRETPHLFVWGDFLHEHPSGSHLCLTRIVQ
jgi:pimeloyl-ACP methyl ester carboxylesterase